MKSFNEFTEVNTNNLMIVDSLNLAFRWKHQKAVDFADEYMQVVSSLQRSYKCDKVIIAGDKGSSSYRKSLLPSYKQNRAEKYAEQSEKEAAEFKAFLAEVQGILDRYTLEGEYPVIRFQGVEADDIAAYIVRNRKTLGIAKIWLISSDRDWHLLVDEGVSQFSYVTRKEFTIENWHEHYDFTKDEYISIKCLMGDAGDNVPGIDGVGPKRARELVQKYGSAFDIASSIPISSKYKYIAALNSFGSDNILRNYMLMDLVTYSAEAIGADNCAIIDKILKDYFV